MLSKAQMGVKIGAVGRQSKSLNANITLIVTNAIGYVIEFGDTSFLTRLSNAVGTGVNHRRLSRYIKDHGAVVWNKEKGLFTVNKNQRKEIQATHADTGAYITHLLTEVDAWHVEPPKVEKEEKPFDVKVWGASQFKKHPEQLDAMIKELQTYRRKADLKIAA